MTTAQATVAPIDLKNFIGRGDFTKERHERPERTEEDVDEDIMRIQAERQGRQNIKPVKWAGN